MRSPDSLFPNPTRMLTGSLIVALASLAGCGKVVVDDETEDNVVVLEESDSRWSFELRGDGVPNENGYVGPFCCTGETAVVEADDGTELGYAYFFGVKGQAYTNGETSFAPDVFLPLAALTDIDPPSNTLEKSEIAFDAEDLVAGSSRSAQAGALLFTVTIVEADLVEWSTGTVFDMSTLAVRVDVDPASAE